MEIDVKFYGFEAIFKALRDIKKETIRKVEEAFKAGAMDFAREAKKRVPVDTGELRSSIRGRVEKTATGFRGVVGTHVVYGEHLEFGTDRISVGTPESPRVHWPAKAATGTKMGSSHEMMPWLRPAWLAVQDAVIKRIRKVL